MILRSTRIAVLASLIGSLVAFSSPAFAQGNGNKNGHNKIPTS
jgi:hypothetical protein